MRPLAILVAGVPVPAALAARGSFSDLIRNAVGDAWSGPWQDVEGRTGGADLPDFERFAGMIVTGSSANVPTREAWIVDLERYLARGVAAGLPIFGICFGHQLLGQALGGLVTKNPNGREIGTVTLELTAADPLLAGLGRSLQANMTHVDTVVTLPPRAQVLARSKLDQNAMVRFAERVWGVQFHPEMDAEVLHHYVAARREALTAEGLDAAAIAAALADTPASAGILRRFAACLPVSP